KRLDNIELRLKANLERIALPKNMANRPYNFFELNPTAKQVSESEYKNQKILESRAAIKKDITHVKEQLALVNKNIEKTKFTRDKEVLPKLVRRKAMFEELLRKYQELLSYAYVVKVKPIYDELNIWADYGGFGMINVNFEMRQDAQNALKYNANIVSQIEEVFRNKKRGIENKIRLIETAVKTMTMNAREEERNRIRAERERTFKEGYFDTRSSEFEPILPEIQLEGQTTKESGDFETEEQKNNDQ
ncbi:MAG: hypothetical protein KAR38_17170, partial [Calditrichia bacterium]|nr:hypothetical protein [Calditrichia bacterium]